MPKAKSKKSKYISYMLRFAVAGTALYLAFRGEDFSKIAKLLLELRFWVFPVSLGIWFLSQVIFVARWLLLLKVLSINIGFLTAFRLHLLGIFYNNCLPTSVGGDLLRAWYVTTHTDKKVEAALSVFVDRVIGLTGMLIMAFSCYWFIPSDGEKERLPFSFNLNFLDSLNKYRWIFAGTGGLIVLVFLAFISSSKGRDLLRSGFGAILKWGAAVLKKIHKVISIYYNKKFALFMALLLTFGCQSIFILGMWLVGRELGIDVNMKYYFIFFPIAWLVGALPISIGALGIWEGTLKLLFGKVALGFKLHVSALALCHRILWLLGSLPGVVIYLVGAHLPKEKISVDYPEAIN